MKRWSDQELVTLASLAEQGLTRPAIAKRMGRSLSAVTNKTEELNIRTVHAVAGRIVARKDGYELWCDAVAKSTALLLAEIKSAGVYP